jgi:hypothetical protein
VLEIDSITGVWTVVHCGVAVERIIAGVEAAGSGGGVGHWKKWTVNGLGCEKVVGIEMGINVRTVDSMINVYAGGSAASRGSKGGLLRQTRVMMVE